jgi:hypothetical protein
MVIAAITAAGEKDAFVGRLQGSRNALGIAPGRSYFCAFLSQEFHHITT